MLQIGKWNWNVQANENGLLWILDSWFTTCSYKEIYVENYELQYHWLRYSEIILFNILFLCFMPFVKWMWMLTSYRM